MAGAQIDDPAGAEQPAHAPRGLPRFVQFFSRQAAGMADGARHAVEERRARKAIQIAIGEPAARRRGKRRWHHSIRLSYAQ